MAKKPNVGGSGGVEGSDSGLAVVLGIGLIVFMLWMAYHSKLAALIFTVKGAEAWVIKFFTPNLTEVISYIKTIAKTKNGYQSVELSQMIEVSNQVGHYVRFLTAPIILAMGVLLYRKSPTEKFKRIYNDKTLPVAVAKLYPWMQISIKNDFAKLDADKGNWAISRTERQFVRIHKLRMDDGEIDRDKTAAVFIKQLGPLWVGYSSLKPHVKALMVLFATRTHKDFSAGDKLLKQLASSAASPSGELDFSDVDRLAQKYINTPEIKSIIAKHAYEKTVMMSMLETCRGGEGGKNYLPPNWFLWLKGVDRPLWYALSDVGRKTYHIESAGVFCHWLTEKVMKKKLEMPWVINAVEGLSKELAKFTNDDELTTGLFDGDPLMEHSDLPMAVNPQNSKA